MTKNEVIEFAKYELSSNNTLIIATLGNGGAGLTLLQDDDEEFINNFASGLNEAKFDGVVEPSVDIEESEYYNQDSIVYQFIYDSGLIIQILGWVDEKTYDVHFQ